MAKKNSKSTVPVVEQPIVTPVVEVLTTPKPEATALIYAVAKSDFVAPKGFAAVLFTEVAKAPGTAAEIVARLLASGEYQRVAPKAAELRPAKPINFLLKAWATSGVLKTIERVALERAA